MHKVSTVSKNSLVILRSFLCLQLIKTHIVTEISKLSIFIFFIFYYNLPCVLFCKTDCSFQFVKKLCDYNVGSMI